MFIETNTAKIIKRLKAEGWIVRHGGEHDVYSREGQATKIAVPRHRTLSPGVARSIAKLAGWRIPPFGPKS